MQAVPPAAQPPLDDAQLTAVLDRLDRPEQRLGKRPAVDRRADPRLAYRRTDLNVRVTQTGVGSWDRVMASRDLCAGGISVLDNRLFYVGSECRVGLRRRLGREEPIDAKIVWVRYVSGRLHIYGLKFADKVFVKHYLQAHECDALLDQSNVEPADLVGRVLLVDDQEMDRMLFAHSLAATGCEVVAVAAAADAADRMAEAGRGEAAKFDLVVCDLNLGGSRGEEAIAGFRAAGFRGPIVALTAESSPARRRAAKEAGANDLLGKPYDPGKLLAQLATWLPVAEGSGIHSTLPETPEVRELLGQYVIQVRQTVATLRDAVAGDDVALARTACQTLKGTGTGYGFELLSEAAEDAVVSLDASQSIEESSAALRLVEMVCLRLSPGGPPKPAAPGDGRVSGTQDPRESHRRRRSAPRRRAAARAQNTSPLYNDESSCILPRVRDPATPPARGTGDRRRGARAEAARRYRQRATPGHLAAPRRHHHTADHGQGSGVAPLCGRRRSRRHAAPGDGPGQPDPAAPAPPESGTWIVTLPPPRPPAARTPRVRSSRSRAGCCSPAPWASTSPTTRP